jgi:RNA polymerase sigma-B factor
MATLAAAGSDTRPRVTLSDAEVLDFVRQFQETQSDALRETLVRQHLPLVEKVARRFIDTGEPLEDLVQEGALGLLTAIDLFDGKYNVKFSTYAHHLVTGQIRHYLRDKGNIIREPAWSQDLRRSIKKAAADLSSKLNREPTTAEIAKACNLTEEALAEVVSAEQVAKVVSLDGFTEDDTPAVDPDKIRSLRHVSFQLPMEDRIVLEELVGNLKQIEQRVIHDFFFMDLSQTEIAKSLGVSCNYVSHLLKSAVKKLGKSMAFTELQERQLRQKTAMASGLDDGEGSIVDRTTNLYTREYYDQRLDEELMRARRYGQDLSTVWIRCENIHEVQERLGAEWVDRTLAVIAVSLKGSVRRCDILAHWDTGTFGALLPHTGDNGTIVRDRLLSTLTEVDFGRNVNLQFRGVCLVVPDAGSSVKEICENAEAQLSAPIFLKV